MLIECTPGLPNQAAQRFKPIELLHLEDSPRDADLIATTLEVAGLRVQVERVEDAESYKAALDRRPYDIILCDYNLPSYGGVDALKLARDRQPDVPVIMISGSIGEDEAINCLHLGATDYLLKGRLERLVPAVSRALNEAEQRIHHRRTEEQFRRSEESFRQFTQYSNDAVWIVELDPERVVYVSPAMEKIWGLSAETLSANPRAWLTAVHPEDQSRASRVWEDGITGAGTAADIEYRVLRSDGSCRWILHNTTRMPDSSGRIDRIGGTAKDITDRKHFEERMLRSQRLESIGTLAGGIAHDLNNTLVPIMISAGLMRMRDTPHPDLVDTIESAAERAASMVRQLLTFAKGIDGSRLLVHSEHLLAEMEKLLNATFPKSISVHTSYRKEMAPVLGDPTQLHQILLNLCVNARDAMADGGTLKIEAETIDISEIPAGSFTDSKPGRYVVWHVTDSGSGIPADLLDRICEPFFTTKGPMGGTGLGLSTVCGIVKSHGGFMDVHSAVGRGATFSIYLPAAQIQASAVPAEGDREPDLRGSGETIIFLDDEIDVRTMVSDLLTSLNYRVITRATGMEALYCAAEKSDIVAAVITDLHMPTMDGVTFAKLLKRMLPNAKIIVTSGNLDAKATGQLKALGVDALLDKPFSHHSIARLLKQVLLKPDSKKPISQMGQGNSLSQKGLPERSPNLANTI